MAEMYNEIRQTLGNILPPLSDEQLARIEKTAENNQDFLLAAASGVLQAAPKGIEDVSVDHVCNSGLAVSQAPASEEKVRD